MKIRGKFKAKFLLDHYLQYNFLKLHNPKQENKTIEEHTREFEQLLLKRDLWEDDT